MPEAGGYFDQDAELINQMAVLGNVYDTITRMRSLRGRDIHSLSTSERYLIRQLRDDGLI